MVIMGAAARRDAWRTATTRPRPHPVTPAMNMRSLHLVLLDTADALRDAGEQVPGVPIRSRGLNSCISHDHVFALALRKLVALSLQGHDVTKTRSLNNL